MPLPPSPDTSPAPRPPPPVPPTPSSAFGVRLPFRVDLTNVDPPAVSEAEVAGDITERLAISFNGSRYDELVTFKAQLEQASRVHLEPNTVRAASGRGGITSELEQVRAELQEQACAGTAGKCWVRLLEPNATVTQGDSCFGSWEIRRSLAHGATVDEPPYISAGAISLSETHHLSQCRLSEPLVVALYVNVTVVSAARPRPSAGWRVASRPPDCEIAATPVSCCVLTRAFSRWLPASRRTTAPYQRAPTTRSPTVLR